MPCACERCLQHSKTLGLAHRPHSKAAIRKAFRAAAKIWHPDRFENDPGKRPAAEEQFKRLQVAYRELWEHCGCPEELPSDALFAKKSKEEDLPSISFGGAPGCFVPPHIPLRAEEIIVAHLEQRERAIGFVDLSGGGSHARNFSSYIFLTNRRVFVRDALNIVSLLWYTDLGEIRLVNLDKDGKPGVWRRIVEKISGAKRRYLLQIYRLNGTHFYSISGQADDSVKKVIYNFLLQRKPKPSS